VERSGTKLRFVETSKARAQVVIRAEGRRRWGCGGHATIGYVHPSWGRAYALVYRGCDRFLAAGVLAHELGHVLGLNHEDRRCATMNSVLWYRCRDAPPTGKWRCRLVVRDDARGAVRRYGREVSDPGPLYCWKRPPPGPPTGITATSNPASGADAVLGWRNSASKSLRRVEIARLRDACPAGPAGGDRAWSRSAKPGKVMSLEEFEDVPLETGAHCYALWSVDEAGRRSKRATAWMNHVELPLPPPTSLTAAANPPSGAFTRLEWTSPAHPRANRVEIWRKLGACPESRDDPDAEWLDDITVGPPGSPASWEDWWEPEPPPGLWCYAAWSWSSPSGRYSATAVTAVRG
jgi:hypothetical protein